MTDKNQKFERAVKMLVASDAMKQVMEFSEEQWRGIVAKMSEEQFDDLLLILDEEQEGYAEIEKEKARKKKISTTKFLQHVEKMKFEHDNPEYKANTNGS